MDGFRGGALGAGQSRGGEGHPITWGAILTRNKPRTKADVMFQFSFDVQIELVNRRAL